MIINVVEGAVVGFAVGVFCPSIARRVKSAFGKEVAKVETDVKADAAKVEKKL